MCSTFLSHTTPRPSITMLGLRNCNPFAKGDAILILAIAMVWGCKCGTHVLHRARTFIPHAEMDRFIRSSLSLNETADLKLIVFYDLFYIKTAMPVHLPMNEFRIIFAQGLDRVIPEWRRKQRRRGTYPFRITSPFASHAPPTSTPSPTLLPRPFLCANQQLETIERDLIIFCGHLVHILNTTSRRWTHKEELEWAKTKARELLSRNTFITPTVEDTKTFICEQFVLEHLEEGDLSVADLKAFECCSSYLSI